MAPGGLGPSDSLSLGAGMGRGVTVEYWAVRAVGTLMALPALAHQYDVFLGFI